MESLIDLSLTDLYSYRSAIKYRLMDNINRYLKWYAPSDGVYGISISDDYN
jgi:hypothetical protein